MTVQGHGWDDNTGYPAFRNLIINGGMSVAQRSSSVASITGINYFTADRWRTDLQSLGTWTQSVENDAPTGSGHRKSLKMLCTTADASPATNDVLGIQQRIEGQNLQHFAKGTGSAKTWALSFWVKANVTGTYTLELYDNDNNRHVCAAYSITSSATWEKKTVILPADSTGIFDNDNALSLIVIWFLGAGSSRTSGTLATSWAAYSVANESVGQVNLASATSNYWQITGVQLEAGPVATPFEFEPYETTLRKCQRYYQRYNATTSPDYIGSLQFYGSDRVFGPIYRTKVPLRAQPTSASISSPAHITQLNSVGSSGAVGISATVQSSGNGVTVNGMVLASAIGSGGANYMAYWNTTNGWVDINAEL